MIFQLLNLIKEAVEQAGFNAIAEHQSSKVMGMIENMNLDLQLLILICQLLMDLI